jgi:hypothetical protein
MKLLALAGNNPNEHEAAAAAAKAQAMMIEYQLTTGDIESLKVDKRTGAGIVEQERTTLRKRGKPGGWKYDLFVACGQTSDCLVYASSGSGWSDSTGRYIGRKDDVEMATYIFEFLAREIERLQDEFGKTRWAELKAYAKQWAMSTHDAERDFSADGRHPLRAKQSWVEGAIEQVVSALWSAKRDRESAPAVNALVLDKKAAIRDWQAQQAGYATWDEYMAARSPISTETVTVKPLTKRQRDAAARANQKYWDAQARAEQRKWASRDIDAYRAGQDAGRQIGVRPGVRGGTPKQEVRLVD